MASSVSGQDESNPALWLATQAGKMVRSCSFGTTRCVPQEKFLQKPYNKSFIDQTCLVKMAGYWPHSFFASLWTLTLSRPINTQKKNLANIQQSWPHAWSITHIYILPDYTKSIGYQWRSSLYSYPLQMIVCNDNSHFKIVEDASGNLRYM